MKANYQDAWALECAALTLLFDWCGELARRVESQIEKQPNTKEKNALLDFLSECIEIRNINHHELLSKDVEKQTHEAGKLTHACKALEKYCNYKKFKPQNFAQTDFAKRILSEAEQQVRPAVAFAAVRRPG